MAVHTDANWRIRLIDSCDGDSAVLLVAIITLTLLVIVHSIYKLMVIQLPKMVAKLIRM